MPKILDSDTIHFQAEGRLLQELGLRLVATPEVALVELVKNSYDADSPSCTVQLKDSDKTLVVSDEGHGMTLQDFKNRWMRIATSNKLASDRSSEFKRPLTGAKGIGRFAVRYLGDELELVTIANDRDRKCVTRLRAIFDWKVLDSADDISKVRIAYSLEQAPEGTLTGTTLTVRKLRSATDFARSSKLAEKVLQIVSPLQGLDRGKFDQGQKGAKKDPGFQLILPGEGASQDINIAKFVLDNFWARLTVNLQRQKLSIRVWLLDSKSPKTLDVQVASNISEGFFADIRFFPRRKGVFSKKGIDGRKAWRWVHDNCGIKIVDHGFHVRPYGFEEDDWLLLDRSKAHNLRDWASEISRKRFGLSSFEKSNPAANPVLYLPYNRQVVGAVFIETQRNLGAKDQVDLISAMDREGLLENKAFAQLYTYIRTGVEFLAHVDKAELDRKAEQQAKAAARTAREEIRHAIEYIQKSPTLTPADKAKLVKQYRNIAEVVDEQEEYSQQAQRSLLTMSLLGVVAGFMTHESKAIVHDLEDAVAQIRSASRGDRKLTKTADQLELKLESFRGHLDYARLFVQGARVQKEQRLSAAGQVRFVLNRFQSFASERGISVRNEIASNVTTPPLPVTIYSGVLLNLYTNALKAVLSIQTSILKPKIAFRAWNEKGKHVIEVLDNGIGIPRELRKRIWDPLYTTTSDVGNPLGSGMGLGLTLVRQVVALVGGKIEISPEAPPGFKTCFRVTFSERRGTT